MKATVLVSLIAHRAFDRHGELCVQPVVVEGAEAGPSHWLTVAKTVNAIGASSGARFVIVLGLEARFGAQLSVSKGLALICKTPNQLA